MRSRRLTPEDVDRIAAMRERGLTSGQIARELDCGIKTVEWHCLKLAVDPPNPKPLRLNHHLRNPVVRRGHHVVRAFTPDEDARLVALRLEGRRLADIARALGRKENSIRGRLMTLARREERVGA